MAALPAEVMELRRQLERRFPDAQPVRLGTTGAVATGIGALDGALPAGGLPRGRVTLWQPGGGATAVLRSACAAVGVGGERAAWVESGEGGRRGGVLTYAAGSGAGGALLFRPPSREAAWCAEELLRSGGFVLVVLKGRGEGLGDGEGIRLGRAAREGGGAVVVVGEAVPVSHLRARSSLDLEGFRWHRDPFGEPVSLESVVIRVRLESMGLDRRTRFRLPVEYHDVRLSLEPGLVDRRGVGR
jgi:hypothetical protein